MRCRFVVRPDLPRCSLATFAPDDGLQEALFQSPVLPVSTTLDASTGILNQFSLEGGALLTETFLGNTVELWIRATAVAIGTLLLFYIGRRYVVHRIAKLASRTTNPLDDMIVEIVKSTKWFFIIMISISAGVQLLTLPGKVEPYIETAAMMALLMQVAIWGNAAIRFGFDHFVKKRVQEDAETATTFSAVSFLSKLVLWVIVLLLALDNLGVNVTGLVAGLGIGGIAVALAVQNILGDLFASLSIVLDKPFVVGDFIVVGEQVGSVEYIGLKTTRIRSLSGEQIVMANSDLLNSRIRNFKRMAQRRIVFKIGVTYQTPVDKLKEISGILKRVIESQPLVRFDRAHFLEFGDSALVYEAVYFVMSSEYNVYMDTQEAINIELYRCFEKEGIEFAYPTRTLHVNFESSNTDAEGAFSPADAKN